MLINANGKNELENKQYQARCFSLNFNQMYNNQLKTEQERTHPTKIVNVYAT